MRIDAKLVKHSLMVEIIAHTILRVKDYSNTMRMNIYVAHKRSRWYAARCDVEVPFPTPIMIILLGRAVHADDDGVVALVGLEGDLLQGLHLLGAHLLNLAGEHGLGLSGGIDAVGLKEQGSVKIGSQ